MSKQTKFILFGIIVMTLVLFLEAFLITANKKIIVKFDTDGGSYISSQEIKNGSLVSKPTDPTKSGYEFAEWQLNGKTFDFSTKIKENITLVAVWEKIVQTYSIQLDVDGIKKIINVNEGDTIDVNDLISFEKEGYEVEWYLDGNKIDIEKEKITSNISFNGKYVEVKVYTVTFDTDGGSGIECQKVNENGFVKEPVPPTKKGYVLDSWYLGDVKYDFDSKVIEDITLKAKWIEDKNLKKHTVTFNSNGGAAVPSQIVLDGKSAIEPNKPTKNGYKFDGWYLNNVKYDFSKVVKSDIVLTGKWIKNQNQYTVVFNSNGGSVVSSQIVVEGNRATKPSNPTRSGYTFKEWQLNGKAYDFNTSIKGNITLIAIWNAIPRYTVTFNSNGGSVVQSQTIIAGNKATRPANPTRNGYTFNGWQLNGKIYDFNSLVTGSITLTAIWTKSVVPDDTYVYFYNPGFKSDAILVKSGDKTMVIDGGTRKSNGIINNFVEYIKTLGITKIDVYVGTHGHPDHVALAGKLIEEFGIKTIYVAKGDIPEYTPIKVGGVIQYIDTKENWYIEQENSEYLNNVYKNYVIALMLERSKTASERKAIESATIKYLDSSSNSFNLGNSRFTVINPVDGNWPINDPNVYANEEAYQNDTTTYSAINPNSLILRMDRGETSFLFSADVVEPDKYTALYNKFGNLLNVDVYKNGHHHYRLKAYSGALKGRLNYIKPKYVVMSTDTKYNFDNFDVDGINSFDIYSVNCGNVVIKSNGVRIEVESGTKYNKTCNKNSV